MDVLTVLLAAAAVVATALAVHFARRGGATPDAVPSTSSSADPGPASAAADPDSGAAAPGPEAAVDASPAAVEEHLNAFLAVDPDDPEVLNFLGYF